MILDKMTSNSSTTLCCLEEAGGQRFYLLTKILEGGHKGLELTLSQPNKAWQTKGRPIKKEVKLSQM